MNILIYAAYENASLEKSRSAMLNNYCGKYNIVFVF